MDGALTYDGRGNVTGNSLSNLQDIVYDIRNLPLQMVTGITAYTVYYGYDDAGHRTRKEVNREKTWYLYDPAGRELGTFKMVPEIGAIKLKSYNLQGNGGSIGRVDVNYTRTGPFINEGDTTYGYTRNDVANYYIKDHLVSVRATMQRASTIFDEDTYPFGASSQRYEDGGTAPQRFDFIHQCCWTSRKRARPRKRPALLFPRGSLQEVQEIMTAISAFGTALTRSRINIRV